MSEEDKVLAEEYIDTRRRVAELESAIRWVVTQKADDLCFRDVYTHLAALLPDKPRVDHTPPTEVFLANCARFEKSMRDGAEYQAVDGTLNLTLTDTYENNIVPNADIEKCLRVIRTIRNCCLGPHFFDADGAVVLSHAHAKIVELAVLGNKQDKGDDVTETPVDL